MIPCHYPACLTPEESHSTVRNNSTSVTLDTLPCNQQRQLSIKSAIGGRDREQCNTAVVKPGLAVTWLLHFYCAFEL